MFKKIAKTKNQPPEIDPEMAEKIHVMPKRFYIAPKKRRSGFIFLIILGVVIVGGLAAAAYFLDENSKKSEEASLNTNTQKINQNINQPASNTNVAPPLINENQNINANLNTGVSTSTNANLNLNINTNTNVNTGEEIPSALLSALDADSDGLTSAEESLFGTNPVLSDSDGDTYNDGSELLDGYDPTQPSATLAESNLFITYNNPNYSIIYPTLWQTREIAEDEVIFQADTGEFVEVLIILNPERLSLSSWYQSQFPNIDLNSVTAVRIGNLAGLRSADELNYYLVDSTDLSRVYLITYNVGNLSQTNFATTFNVMVKNFKLKPIND